MVVYPCQSVSREDYRWRRGNAPYDTAVGFVVMTRAAGTTRVPVFDPRYMKGMSPSFVKATSGMCTKECRVRGDLGGSYCFSLFRWSHSISSQEHRVSLRAR